MELNRGAADVLCWEDIPAYNVGVTWVCVCMNLQGEAP